MNASVSAMRMPSTHRTRVLCIVCFMRNPFEIFSPFYHARAGFSMLSQKFNFYMTPKRPGLLAAVRGICYTYIDIVNLRRR